ncbi:MAG: hypothetical protein JNN12_12030 [Bacteroidetes Order II. Incertae sedis bacterium]|nr:hypothetical protein [Bacteroidetes Order II. bacterium]
MQFNALPPDAQAWVYIADRPLSASVQQAVLEQLKTFFSTWKSHGRPVRGAARFWADRFLCVGAFIEGGTISGCGIDASVHAIGAVPEAFGFAWESPLKVFYRDATGAVQSVPRAVFRKMVQEQHVGSETIVFNPGITEVQALENQSFELPLKDAWHARVFRLPAATSV